MNRSTAGLIVAGVLASFALLPSTVLAIDNAECLACHEDKGLTRKDAAGKEVSLFVDAAKFATSVHKANACTSCHVDITEAPHPDKFVAKRAACDACHAKMVETYESSTHGIAHRAGKADAANCEDCHGKHDIVRAGLTSSPLHHVNQGATCGKCHPQILKDVQESVHGKAMAEGVYDAPSCVDCHSDHAIQDLRMASPMKIAEQVCSRCHASERLRTRYKLPANRVSTFFDSYHGLAARMGATNAANCASCHGFHSILPSSDPRSMVNKANMVKTCRKCHPEANEKFSQGRIHVNDKVMSESGTKINWWVRQLYLLLIVATIGGMLIHNTLALRRKLVKLYLNPKRTVLRMTLAQRVQHWLLLVSFITLAITGFALKYPDSWIAYLVGNSEPFRRISHRAAAVLMMLLAVYHAYYLLATREGRKLLWEMLPRIKDITDVFGNLRYLLFGGLKPKFARFGYPEKAEYWAVVWGTIIMGVTGLIIWFKFGFTLWLPRWMIDVANTIHYYEAILAVLAIIVWHFYHVIFDPDVFPVNWAWWDGRVSAEWYEEEHGLDHETLETIEEPKSHKDDPKGSGHGAPPAAGKG